MNPLEEELCLFWQWAGISLDEYLMGIPPKNPDIYSGAEWEDSYRNWDKIEAAFIHCLKEQQNKASSLEKVIEAIEIDNESERLADFVFEIMTFEVLVKLLEKALNGNFLKAQYQLVSRLGSSDFKNKREYLSEFMIRGGNEYVRQKAKYFLE